MPKPGELTDKQQAFVAHYLVSLNATDAAIKAKYSKRTAQAIGAENLTKPLIAKAIAIGKAERSEETGIDAEYVLRQLAGMQEAEVTEILNDDGTMMDVSKWPSIWQRMVSAVEIIETFDGKGEDRIKTGTIKKIKLIERGKVMEMLGRHVDVGAFVDRQEHVHRFDLATAITTSRGRIKRADG